MSWLARFDERALRPPIAGPGGVPADLLNWCRTGDPRFAWRDCSASPDELNALMRELDGDRALQALASAAARWQVRLGLKLREAMGWRRADDPWDAGHLRELDALLQFEPRRPTLIVADASQQAARELLATRAPLFCQPVRLLLRR